MAEAGGDYPGMLPRTLALASFVACPILGSAWLAGCGDSAAIPIEDGTFADDPGFGDGGGGGNDDGAGGGGDGGASADFCSGAGVSIPIPGTTGCSGDLARKLFRFAACSCTDLDLGGTIRTASFNSNTGTTNDQGASIAANASLTLAGTGGIGGSAFGGGQGVAAGRDALSCTGQTTLQHDAWSGRDMTAVGDHVVKGDAYVSGKLTGASIRVEGKLHTPSGQVLGPPNTSGGSVAGPVTVAPPCDCGSKLDIAAIVAPFKTANDNASIDLAPDALAKGGTLTLPCGRYHLTEIGGSVTLHLKGRTAIFVDGDISIAGGFTIDLEPGSELDLFAAGDFSLAGTANFGSLDAPSKVRVYTGGSRFGLAGSAELGGNFYAPNADIQLASAFKMSGAIFGNELSFAGGFDIRYDEAVLDVQGCEKPGGGCNSCNDCPASTPACKGGTCGACTSNADCCSPLRCSNGQCVPDIR